VRPTKPTERSFCGICHAEDAPTPLTIPRVDLSTHGEDYLCWQCHYPHYPEIEL
jgi:ribosomal protein S27AE